jgi:hypothetical protein
VNTLFDISLPVAAQIWVRLFGGPRHGEDFHLPAENLPYELRFGRERYVRRVEPSPVLGVEFFWVDKSRSDGRGELGERSWSRC